LVGLHALHSLVPSAVVRLAVWHGTIDGAKLCQEALVEEWFQIQQWGQDPEVQVRIESIEHDMAQLMDYIQNSG